MHAAYVRKVNSVVEAGRDDLAHELAQTFAEESSGGSATVAHVVSPRGQATTRLGTVGRFTRSSVERFDRYTLEVFNAG
jgi:hypothetical protein